MRTAAWYGDRELDLEFPPEWEVSYLWPTTPPPLDLPEIASRLRQPLAQRPLRELAVGRSKPAIIVDDLNRPTPAASVLPIVLAELEAAGIGRSNVRVVLATGTHGAPPPGGMEKKVGPEAAAACRLHVHDPRGPSRRLGRSSFGTPVRVNPDIAAADLVIGLGGIYPNHTAGFGGGSKIALGVLGYRTIFTLHHGHASAGWGSGGADRSFRRDLDEIARMIGLETTISVQVDADRRIVALWSGDPASCLDAGIEFTRKCYEAPDPGGADVVVCNAYPGDLSLTFSRMKGSTPFRRATPAASKVLISSCAEGLGFHGLFPFLNAPRGHRTRRRVLLATMVPPSEVARRALGVARRRFGRRTGRRPSGRGKDGGRPVWLYRPEGHLTPLPAEIPGIRVATTWEETIAALRDEHGGRDRLKVAVYPCSSLQTLVGGSVPDDEDTE
jgi:lactate racemase